MVEPLVLYPVLWLMFCHGGWCYCHLVAKLYKIADVIAMVAVVIATFFFFFLWLMLLPQWLMLLPLGTFVLADVIAVVADVITTQGDWGALADVKAQIVVDVITTGQHLL